MLLFVDIQFLTQPHCQTETGDEAVDGQILGNLIFAVDDLQHQFSLRLLHPLDELLMASLDFGVELRCREFVVEAIV